MNFSMFSDVTQFEMSAWLAVFNDRPWIIRNGSKGWICYRHDDGSSPTLRAESFEEICSIIKSS